MAKDKEAYYFSHDSNARNDPKISAMRCVYGTEGYGWYWMLVEMMREQKTFKLDMQSKYTYRAMALQLQCEADAVKKFVQDCIDEFQLFESDGITFWSNSLVRRMEKKEQKSEQYSENARKRWDKSKSDAIALQSDSNGNALKESKVKESKGNIKDINTSSRKSKAISEDDTYYRMARYLHDRIMEHAIINKVDHLVRNAKLDKWADEFRKMIEIDKRDKQELREIIDWCSKDPFWSKNILSADKLRKQYERLGIEKSTSKGKPQSRTKDEQNKDILNRRMEAIKNDRRTDGEASGPYLNGLPEFPSNGGTS